MKELWFSIIYSIICGLITAMVSRETNDDDNKGLGDFIENHRKKFITGLVTTFLLLGIGISLVYFIFYRSEESVNYYGVFVDLLSFSITQLITWGIVLWRFEKKLYKRKDTVEKIGGDSPYHFNYDGVFAVSAIMVSNDYKKFLLVKRNSKDGGSEKEDLWVQPGAYYRTNVIKCDNNKEKLPALFDFIKAEIHNETGLHDGDYQPIFINNLFIRGKPWQYTVSDKTVQPHENKLYEPPLFIQEEVPIEYGGHKTSNTSVHIDSFYSFRLNKEVDGNYLAALMDTRTLEKCKKIKLFTLDEIKKISCYPDIPIILEKFLIQFRKGLFLKNYKSNIRFCTFNPKKKILWLRINDHCNLSCTFCLMKFRDTETKFELKIDSLNTFIKSQNELFGTERFKVVVTGGEPFLINNIFDVISTLVGYDWVDSVSICTNGTQQQEINTFAGLLKAKMSTGYEKIEFVINMPAYRSSDYSSITGKDEFSKQRDVVKSLIDDGISVTANVVMTYYLRGHLHDYIDYWSGLGIKNISFSYAIHIGIDERKEAYPGTLSKSECLDLYNTIGNGKYAIENFNEIELLIPSCDERQCRANRNIISCYVDNDGNFIRNKNKKGNDCCLDTNC